MSTKEIECKVREILLFRAQNRLGPINYKSLAKLLELNTECFFTKWLMPILKALKWLDRESKITKTPRLSALVVRAKTGLPGKGYWQNTLIHLQAKNKKMCQQLHDAEVDSVLLYFAPLKPQRA